jgi:hypothetical protein
MNFWWDLFNKLSHVLIMDGDGSHVILQAIKQTHQFGLSMATLPSHISRVLQALDVQNFIQEGER